MYCTYPVCTSNYGTMICLNASQIANARNNCRTDHCEGQTCLIWYKYKHMVFQTKGVSFPLQVMSLTLFSCPLWDHCREGSITKVWQTKAGLERIWALSQTHIAFVWDWPELNLDLSYLVSSMQCACDYCLSAGHLFCYRNTIHCACAVVYLRILP